VIEAARPAFFNSLLASLRAVVGQRPASDTPPGNG